MLHTNSEDRKNSLFVQLLTCIKCTRLPVCGGTMAICSRNMPFLAGNMPCHAGNTLTCAENRPIHTRNMPIRTGYTPIRAEYTLLHTGNFLFQCWPEVSVGNIHIPLHMVVAGIAQDTRLSPSFPFQPQCRKHTVVIGTHIFLPGALQPANRSTCRHPY